MKPIFLGVCALLTPFLYDHYKRGDKIKKKVLLESIKRKYQLVVEKTDISQISEDYPVIVYKKIKHAEILDYDLGLKFSDVLALKRKIEIVDKDTLTEQSVQPTKFRSISDKELNDATFGKLKNSEFNFFAKHAYLDKIKLKDYFFTKFQNQICQVVSGSTSLIANPKNTEGEFILQNENDLHNKYLSEKFIDLYTNGNNVFIQANRNKLLKNDLKINYLAYKPTNFLLIGCKEKSIKFLEKNNSSASTKTAATESNLKNANAENNSENHSNNANSNKEFELVLKPVTRFLADDYVVIPYQILDEAKAKEEIDRLLKEEIRKLDLKPWQKKIRKVFYLGGIVFIGYGYLVYKVKHSLVWNIKDMVVGFLKIAFKAFV